MSYEKNTFLVGLADKVPDGQFISPWFVSRANNGVVDLRGARGLVLATETPRVAAHRAWRDVMRGQLDGGYGGQVSTYLPAGGDTMALLASDYAKEVMETLAWDNADGRDPRDSVIGHIHEVTGNIQDDPNCGQGSFISDTSVRVLGSRAIVYGEFIDFGFSEVPDPLTVQEIASDIRAVYASGVLSMAAMRAVAASVC